MQYIATRASNASNDGNCDLLSPVEGPRGRYCAEEVVLSYSVPEYDSKYEYRIAEYEGECPPITVASGVPEDYQVIVCNITADKKHFSARILVWKDPPRIFKAELPIERREGPPLDL